MPLSQLILLSLVQGLTEFLPVSSSAHLILAPIAAGMEDQSPLIDVMAHAGSLVAVLVYFWRDIRDVAIGKLAWLSGRMTPGGRLALLIGAATPPIIIGAGALYLTGHTDLFRSPLIIGIATLVFAVPLWAADKYGRAGVTTETMSYRDAFLIGLVQIFALIPGASRSGVTMTAGRALGLGRSEAARFSMLMAIPVIAAFALVAGLDLAQGGNEGASLTDGLIVAALSFLSAWASIAVMMRFVERVGFLPFVIYRLILAGLIFWLLV
ncbi:undecaprenyl-diphosphate phosphatase [Hyphobacterium sp. CCMP332]|uniref:undecaprenyl-diphosphate phosphatase n=1 Tax=Hyphobacterium sp. CCMP332 TaxID=2749086 RepID=UPI00164EFAD6|nr:undecaprenyl-diphosphate phosphatase [Hyphobacterium sp. CCMP332]QNL20073.1 undecaprenyl-diphosphate phosphatase [Hyphobacterium sp. CCMP332]